jgi:hypothetical protein
VGGSRGVVAGRQPVSSWRGAVPHERSGTARPPRSPSPRPRRRSPGGGHRTSVGSLPSRAFGTATGPDPHRSCECPGIRSRRTGGGCHGNGPSSTSRPCSPPRGGPGRSVHRRDAPPPFGCRRPSTPAALCEVPRNARRRVGGLLGNDQAAVASGTGARRMAHFRRDRSASGSPGLYAGCEDSRTAPRGKASGTRGAPSSRGASSIALPRLPAVPSRADTRTGSQMRRGTRLTPCPSPAPTVSGSMPSSRST